MGSRSRGFTLIEVISVIAILAVLGMGTMTALRAVKRSALRQQAAVEAAEIAQAVLRYRGVYGKWPGEDSVEKETDSTAIVAGEPYSDDRNGGLESIDLSLDRLIRALDIPHAGESSNNDNYRAIQFLELPDRCFRKTGKDGNILTSSVPLDPWGRPYVVVMASSKGNDGKKSRTVSHVEGGVYAANIRTENDSFTVDSPEDVVVFSWGDPLMPTNSTAPTRVIGSWRVEQ